MKSIFGAAVLVAVLVLSPLPAWARPRRKPQAPSKDQSLPAGFMSN